MSARTRRLLIAACIVGWGVLLVIAIAGPVRAATPQNGPEIAQEGTVDAIPARTGVRNGTGVTKPATGVSVSQLIWWERPAATPPVPPSVVATRSDPDQTGVRASAYTGRYYRAGDEGYRRCVAFREGRGQYWGTGRNGFYQSTYQMTNALVRGAAWMMTDELKTMWPDHWRLVRDTLLDTPGHLWRRFYMDMAWWTVANWNGPRSGFRHWHLAGSGCVPGMAAR